MGHICIWIDYLRHLETIKTPTNNGIYHFRINNFEIILLRYCAPKYDLKTIVMISLGAVLLIVSFLYNKYMSNILKEENGSKENIG